MQSFITKCLSFPISSSELFSRIYALYRETLHLNNPFQKKILSKVSISIQIPSSTRIDTHPAVILINIRCHPYKRASGPLVCGNTKNSAWYCYSFDLRFSISFIFDLQGCGTKRKPCKPVLKLDQSVSTNSA